MALPNNPPSSYKQTKFLLLFLTPFLYLLIRLIQTHYFPDPTPFTCTTIDHATYVELKKDIEPRYPSVGPRGFTILKGEGKSVECFVLEVGETEVDRERFRSEHEVLWGMWDRVIGV